MLNTHKQHSQLVAMVTSLMTQKLTLPLSSSDRKLELTSNLLTELPSDIFAGLVQPGNNIFVAVFFIMYV
jgi:hypothetical protein